MGRVDGAQVATHLALSTRNYMLINTVSRCDSGEQKATKPTLVCALMETSSVLPFGRLRSVVLNLVFGRHLESGHLHRWAEESAS